MGDFVPLLGNWIWWVVAGVLLFLELMAPGVFFMLKILNNRQTTQPQEAPAPIIKTVYTADPEAVRIAEAKAKEIVEQARKDAERLVLSVNLLQRSIAVEVDRTYIKPLPKNEAASLLSKLQGEKIVTLAVPAP